MRAGNPKAQKGALRKTAADIREAGCASFLAAGSRIKDRDGQSAGRLVYDGSIGAYRWSLNSKGKN